MKGSVAMAKLCYEDQANAIISVLKEEIEHLRALPKDEAKAEAHKGLVSVGIIDESGNYTAPYVALGKQYVQQKNKFTNGISWMR